MISKSLVLLALASLCAGQAQAAEEVRISPAQEQALGVQTARLSPAKSAQTMGLPARVVLPNNQLYIVSAPLAGFLEKMEASVNQHVKKGQILALLQSPPLAEAERAYLQAQTQFQLSKEVMLRDRQLFDEGIIAQSRFSASKSRYVESEAALSGQKQVLKLSGLSEGAIKNLLEKGNIGSTLEIRSPIDGVVLEQAGIAGQRVDAAAPIYQVAKLSPLWLDIEVPTALLPGLKEGSSVSVPASHSEGTVASIGKSINPTSQTAMVRALMTGNIDSLRPGLKVEVRISGASENVWQLPNSALTRIDGKPAVFVKTRGGFRVKSIELVNEGEKNSLVGGLDGGDAVAVHGVAALKAAISGNE
ncbi:MAG: efflux RND transporter periplasmic adaptor subunit [Burkholderiales bacterium]|nr:efflux RND transporter periplasmic adaptor subunit [Burkholderiales bacterium]